MLSALILGLLGSVHCLGMCGPIALAVPVDRSSRWRVASGISLYHLSRLMGYATIGLLFGKIGHLFDLGSMQQWVSILSGSLIALYVIINYVPGIKTPTFFSSSIVVQRFRNKVLNQFHRTSPEAQMAIGLANAFLPCGLVFVAVAAALNTTSALHGAAYMALFGLGTVPALLGLRLLGSNINQRINTSRLVPITLSVFATLLIVRGLALDVPFLSPVIDPIKGFVHSCLP